jgi:hypothetical protein
MSPTPPQPDAREVDRIEILATPDDPALVDDFLALSVPLSSWSVQIRTAGVSATLLARRPLGSIDERTCTCLSLELDRPVPVEPGLRVRIRSAEDPRVTACAVIRPWGG